MLRRLLPAALVVQVFVVVACGGLSLPRQTPAPPPPVSPPATSAPAPEAARPVALVMSITVSERPADMPDYDRDDWDHWNDADRDCQDTRQEVLVAESSVAVRFTDDRECRVASGRWADPYTGDTVEDPGKLDVDHMVPLANAHASGGHAWSEQRKELYANSLIYPEHLIAVTASANRSKGANGPDGWRPPNRTYWCQYASDWIAIKNEWGLTATESEAAALREMLETCGHSVFLQVSDPEDVAADPDARCDRRDAVYRHAGDAHHRDAAEHASRQIRSCRPGSYLLRLRWLGRGAGVLLGGRRARLGPARAG